MYRKSPIPREINKFTLQGILQPIMVSVAYLERLLEVGVVLRDAEQRVLDQMSATHLR